MTPPYLAVDLGPGVRAGFTERVHDGRAFNLSPWVGEEGSATRPRHLLEDWFGAPVNFARQVHGAGVHRCGGSVAAAGADADAAGREADALVTTEPGTAVGVLVADCVPVLLADPAAGVVGAVHAGRRGLVAGVVPAAVRAMADLGATRLAAAIGPSICGACYEVPAALQEEVAGAVPGTATTTSSGTPGLDLRAGVLAQLADLGVAAVAVVDACTLEDDRWFSHRAGSERAAGRFAAVVAREPQG